MESGIKKGRCAGRCAAAFFVFPWLFRRAGKLVYILALGRLREVYTVGRCGDGACLALR